MRTKYLTIPKLAKSLGVSRITVYKRVKAGKIKALKIGKTYFISERVLDRLRGRELTREDKRKIDRAVRRTVKQFGETLRLLGKLDE